MLKTVGEFLGFPTSVQGPRELGPAKTRDGAIEDVTWLAESLRMTAFLPPEVAEHCADWSGLVGEEPESERSAPRLQQVQQQGNFDGAYLTHRRAPGRVDWFLTAPPDPEDGPRPTLEFSSDVRSQFLHLMNRWLRGAELIDRLAFGVILIQPTADKDASYRSLDDYLPAVHVDPQSSEFSYRVNRRRPSNSMAGLEINRLSTWSAMHAALLLIDPNAEAFTSAGEPEHFCKLELDINTVPSESTTLDAEQSYSVLEELVSLAVEISETGDCP